MTNDARKSVSKVSAAIVTVAAVGFYVTHSLLTPPGVSFDPRPAHIPLAPTLPTPGRTIRLDWGDTSWPGHRAAGWVLEIYATTNLQRFEYVGFTLSNSVVLPKDKPYEFFVARWCNTNTDAVSPWNVP